jgi:serine/threonine protein kinase
MDKEVWARLSPRLDELLELPESERDARLADIGRDDAALAADLSLLLAQQTRADRFAFLEGGALDAAAHATLTGQTIGAYTLERPLGEGGMSAVWLGRRSDGRYEGQVAVKFLNLALLTRGGAERFAREGSMLARLTHPNIARLFDAGLAASTAAAGQPYLVLEYIEGVPIDRYCDSNALSVEQRLRLFLDVLAAVAHAHTNLILHRDLKPSNILVTAQGQVKLLDFGIGKLLAEQNTAASSTELTQLAGRAFTPDYAAPEQIQGGDVTTATDVYALGVLLYELLAGRHPTTLSTDTPVDRVRAVVDREPTRVSEAAAKADEAIVRARATTAHKLARTLRGDLDNIVAKALKKLATQRYPTVVALADDLRRYLDHAPVSARADSLAYRASKFVRRYRLAVGAASVTVLALVAGVIGTTWQATEAQHQRNMAVRQLERAEATNSFISFLLNEVSPDGRPFTSTDLMQRGDQWVDRLFAGKPELHAEMLVVLAERYGAAGDLKRELATLKRAHELAQREGDLDLRARIGCRYGAVWFINGNGGKAAEREIDQAVKRLQHVVTERPAYASCLMSTSVNARYRNENDRAVEIAERALAIVDGMPTPSAELQRKALETLASAYTFSGRFGAADGLYEKILEAMRTAGLENSMEMGVVTSNAGMNLHGAGALRQALARHEQSLKIFAQGHPDGRIAPFTAQVHAGLNHFTGRTEAARDWLQKAIASARASGSDRVLGIVMAGAASIYLDLDDLVQAEAALNEAEPLLEKSTPPSHSSRVGLVVSRARFVLARGNPGVAKELMQQAIATIQPVTPWHPTLASTYSRLALVNVQLGELDEAAQNAEAAEKVARRLMGDLSSSFFLGQALSAQGAVLRARGNEQGAAEAYRAALAQLEDALGLDAPLTQLARQQLAGATTK